MHYCVRGQEDQSASKAMLFQKLVVLALFNVTSNQLVAEVVSCAITSIVEHRHV